VTANTCSARINSAAIPVIAVHCRAGADSAGTSIVTGAGIAVIANRSIVVVYASASRTGIVCAGIPVITVHCRAGADPAGTSVVPGAGIAVIAGCPIKLSRTLLIASWYSCVSANTSSAGIGCADIAVVAIKRRSRLASAI